MVLHELDFDARWAARAGPPEDAVKERIAESYEAGTAGSGDMKAAALPATVGPCWSSTRSKKL